MVKSEFKDQDIFRIILYGKESISMVTCMGSNLFLILTSFLNCIICWLCQSGRHGRDNELCSFHLVPHLEECSPPSVTMNSEFIFLTFMEHCFSYLKCGPFELAIRDRSITFDELLVQMNSFQQIFLMKSKEYHLLLKVWKNIITFHRFLKKSYCTFNRLLMESYLSPKWAKIGAQNLVWQIGSWQYGPTLHLKNWYAPGPFLRTPYLFWEYLFCFILISCRCLTSQNFFFFFGLQWANLIGPLQNKNKNLKLWRLS
jgi:hypothetical protein